MDNTISELPLYTGNTTGVFLIMNNSGETTTYKVTKETLITGSGTSGTSGSSGTSGINGTSGSSGVSGSNGSSGTSGSNGSSGTSGVSGTSGSNGSSGTSGTSGSNGTSGDSLFSQTGSVWNTTNNVGITGSFYVDSGSGLRRLSYTNGYLQLYNSNNTNLVQSAGTSINISNTGFTISSLLNREGLSFTSGSDSGSLFFSGNSLSIISNKIEMNGSTNITGSIYVSNIPSGSTSNEVVVYNTSTNQLERKLNSSSSGTSGSNGSSGTSGSDGSSYGIVSSFYKGYKSTSQTSVTTGSELIFDTNENSFGSDISLNVSTGEITLKANKTYRLRSNVGYVTFQSVAGMGGHINFQWYDKTNSTYIGRMQNVVATASSTENNHPNGGTVEAVITPTTDIVVVVKIVSSIRDVHTSVTITVGNSSVLSWFDIEVIGGNNTVTNSTANQVITYSSNPTGISAGFMYFNTTDNHFYGYNGTTWKQLDN